MRSFRFLVQGEIGWTIGSGSDVSITNDRWVGHSSIARWPTFVNVELLPQLSGRVQELVLPNGDWNRNLIYMLFGEALALRVLSIPRPRHVGEDAVGWRLSGSVKVIAADVYKLLDEYFEDGIESYAWPWRLACSPRVKSMCWRLASNILPCKHNLSRRGLVSIDSCSICGLETESQEHVCFRCPQAWRVWRIITSLTNCQVRVNSFDGALRCLKRNTKAVSVKFKQTVISYGLWEIWKSRNLAVFQSSSVSPMVVATAALKQAMEYWRTLREEMSQPLMCWDSPGCYASSLQHPIYVLWQSPPLGWLKINFDGSSVQHDGLGGAGFVIRDYLGRLVMAKSFPLNGITVPLAELRGAWEGCRSAVFELGARKIWLEGDAMGVIQWIQGMSKVDGYAVGLLRDIREWTMSLDEFRVSHIHREGNYPADYMANGGSKGNAFVFFMNNMPTELFKLVCDDAQGCCKIRRVR